MNYFIGRRLAYNAKPSYIFRVSSSMSTLPSPESLRFSCRRIFLKNLRLACRIGAYETERSAPQSVVFNADIWVRFSASSSQRDALEDVLNYDLAVEIFREESSRGHIDLQETLVDRIAERLSNLPGVELIRISSEKTEAYAIGVEVWRSGSPLLT
mgnify:CR=1 FL=1